jgi:hypothetical protein
MKKGPPRPRPKPEELTAINEQFKDEVDRYKLVYRCQDCVHFRPDNGRCVLGYPNDVLSMGEIRALDERGQFVFCKDFALEDL